MSDGTQPTTTEGAQARLTELTGNAEWGAKLMAGDAATRTEFDNLSRLASGVTASSGFEQPGASPTVEQMIEQQKADEARREVGLLDQHFNLAGLPASNEAGVDVREWATGKKSITPELRAMAEAKLQAFSRDRDFMRRLFDGGQEENRLLAIASAMLIAPVEAKA